MQIIQKHNLTYNFLPYRMIAFTDLTTTQSFCLICDLFLNGILLIDWLYSLPFQGLSYLCSRQFTVGTKAA